MHEACRRGPRLRGVLPALVRFKLDKPSELALLRRVAVRVRDALWWIY